LNSCRYEGGSKFASAGPEKTKNLNPRKNPKYSHKMAAVTPSQYDKKRQHKSEDVTPSESLHGSRPTSDNHAQPQHDVAAMLVRTAESLHC